MKILSIFGIILSFIGLIISIILLVKGTNTINFTNIFSSSSAEVAMVTVIHIAGVLLIINTFFFAFSIVAVVKSFMKKDKNNNLLPIFAIIISVIAIIIVIAVIAVRTECIGHSDYIAIAATILTCAVTFAVGYNIYSNLFIFNKLEKKVDEVSLNSTASSNYTMAVGFYKKDEYNDALRFCKDAKLYFEACNHTNMVVKCESFINEINEKIKNNKP